MVQELAYFSNVSEIMAEASGTELRSLMRQVEVELHHSSTYGRVVSSLQTLPTEMGQQLQRMMNAIGREAIRLAFRQWEEASSKPSSKPSSEASSPAAPPPPPPRPFPDAVPAVQPVKPSETQPRSTPKSSSPASIVPVHQARPVHQSRPVHQARQPQPRRLSKKEAAQAALQSWETQLRQIGAEVRRVRQSQAQSPYQLHLKTQVPLHQIEALETGQVDRLPEDVYIRGFLRRIGDALGLDGVALAASLPPVDPVKAILPTWYHPNVASGSGSHLRPIHLYVGYAALLAGGFTWLTHQSALQEPTRSAPPPIAPPAQNPTSSQRHSARLSESVKSIAAVSAPERLLSV